MNDEPTNSVESYHRVIDILFSGVTHESAWEMLRVIAAAESGIDVYAAIGGGTF